MKASAINTQQQNLEDIFIEQLDNIYYPGYTEDMIETNPDRLIWELKEFQSQFSKKN